MARNTSHPQQLDADNIGASSENNESLNPILCAVEKVRETTIIALTAFGLANCQSAIADKKHLQVVDASGRTPTIKPIVIAKQESKIPPAKVEEKVIVPKIQKQAFSKNDAPKLRGGNFDDESLNEQLSNELDLKGSITDEKPLPKKVALANLKENPHVPAGLRRSIIDEARRNGADEDFDIPGLEDYLNTLAKTGDLKDTELEQLLRMSPKTGSRLPLVVAVLESNQRLDNANQRLDNANQRLDSIDKNLARQKMVNGLLSDTLRNLQGLQEK